MSPSIKNRNILSMVIFDEITAMNTYARSIFITKRHIYIYSFKTSKLLSFLI